MSAHYSLSAGTCRHLVRLSTTYLLGRYVQAWCNISSRVSRRIRLWIRASSSNRRNIRSGDLIAGFLSIIYSLSNGPAFVAQTPSTLLSILCCPYLLLAATSYISHLSLRRILQPGWVILARWKDSVPETAIGRTCWDWIYIYGCSLFWERISI